MATKIMRGKRTNNFPRDVILTILSKLPCKSILRFKIVCKEWFDIVTTDPIFAETHHGNNPTSLACREAIIDCYKLKESEKLDTYKFDDTRFVGEGRFPWDSFDVMSSSKGFLLKNIHFFPKKMPITIYNPLTNEAVFLPDLSTVGFDPVVGGLGFSPDMKRFKVVIFGRGPKLELQIYTLGYVGYSGRGPSTTIDTCAWRTASLPEAGRRGLPYLPITNNNPVELNGILHLLAHIKCKDLIACFDVDKEVLAEMSIPKIEKSYLSFITSIGLYRGLLYLGISFDVKPHRVEMWVMKQYGVGDSWMRLVVIKEPVWGFKFQYVKLVDILDTGEIIFVSSRYYPRQHANISYLLSYDPINESYEKLHFPEDYSTMNIYLHTPSFFSLKT